MEAITHSANQKKRSYRWVENHPYDKTTLSIDLLLLNPEIAAFDEPDLAHDVSLHRRTGFFVMLARQTGAKETISWPRARSRHEAWPDPAADWPQIARRSALRLQFNTLRRLRWRAL